MPIVTDGPVMEPENKGIDEFHLGYGASIGATARQAFEDLPVHQLADVNEMDKASGQAQPDFGEAATGNATPPATGPGIAANVQPDAPNIDMIDANDRVKKAGLASQLTLPDQPDIPPAQLAIMMDRARRRQELATTLDRGPQGFVASALDTGTSFLVGAVDPLNIASGFVPVMGELRYGKLLASAGDSLTSRLALRAGVGAAQGVAGQAALEPLDWWSQTQDGRDFGMADVLHNLMFGAALGGGMHGAGGFISDAYRGAKGRPLYPFGPGEPMENVSGTHVPAAVLGEEGVSADALHDHLGDLMTRPDAAQAEPERVPGEALDTARTTVDINGERAVIDTDLAAPSSAVMTINDLPQRAHEDAMRGAIANLIEGEPVRSGEMLEAAAQTDPRIRESFDAWHGSPHDFDRFDLSKIGTGEGAQAYGHGLYFAENERVARGYQKTTSEKAFIDKVATLYDEGHSPDDAWAEIKDNWKDFTPQEQRLMTALHGDDWLGFDYPHQAVSAALGKISNYDPSAETVAAARAVGNMYRVKIAANHDHFLDWDKPLDEQSEHVRKALLDHPDQSISGTAAKWGYSIPSLYSRLSQRLGEHVDERGERWGAQGPSVASKALRDAGIPGIKYLDQGSRAPDVPASLLDRRLELRRRLDQIEALPEEQRSKEIHAEHEALSGNLDQVNREIAAYHEANATSNFVVFDDKHIEITHKNGEPVKREEIQRSQPAEPKAPTVTGFTTAKGSTYSVHEDGTTTRDKAARPDVGHEGDSGIKPRTERTIYVDGDASRLSGAGLQGDFGGKGYRVAIRDGKATFLWWNEEAQKWGAPPSGRDIPFSTTPEVGKSPVELWKKADDVPGHEAYRGQHAGNKITEVTHAPEASTAARHVEPKAPRGRAAADPQTWSLFEFLSHEGGLKPDPELNAIFGNAKGPFVPSFGALVRPGGRTLDDALRLAKDHGYLFDAADVTGAEGRLTPNDLLDRLAEENSGRKQYRHDENFATKAQDRAALERETHDIISALHDEIESGTGIKGSKIDPRLEDRVVEIMTREGEHDVMAAYERAIMEDEERYNAETGQSNRNLQPVAGRDVSDDGRAAPAGGDGSAGPGGPAGNAGARAGADAGGQPRPAGRNAGASPQAQLNRDAAWRQLAQAKPEFDDPDVVAASQAATEVKAPPSKLDERVSAAEKADAFAKQMYDMFAHRLPEEDRVRLDDLIKRIDDDHEARETAIVRGGSCLFGVL